MRHRARLPCSVECYAAFLKATGEARPTPLQTHEEPPFDYGNNVLDADPFEAIQLEFDMDEDAYTDFTTPSR